MSGSVVFCCHTTFPVPGSSAAMTPLPIALPCPGAIARSPPTQMCPAGQTSPASAMVIIGQSIAAV